MPAKALVSRLCNIARDVKYKLSTIRLTQGRCQQASRHRLRPTTRIPRAQRTRRRPRPVYLSTYGESRRIANSNERATSTTEGEDGSGKIGKWSGTSMVERYGVGCKARTSCSESRPSCQPRWFGASSMALRR